MQLWCLRLSVYHQYGVRNAEIFNRNLSSRPSSSSHRNKTFQPKEAPNQGIGYQYFQLFKHEHKYNRKIVEFHIAVAINRICLQYQCACVE